MAWVDVSCPAKKCGLNRRLNGIGRCICGALLIYRPSPRRKAIELPPVAYQWTEDGGGLERVHRYTDTTVVEERGYWQRLHGERLSFVHRDGRRTAQPIAMPLRPPRNGRAS